MTRRNIHTTQTPIVHRTLICLITCLIAPSAIGLSVTNDVIGQIATQQTIGTTIVSDTLTPLTSNYLTMRGEMVNETKQTPTSTSNTPTANEEKTTSSEQSTTSDGDSGASTSTTTSENSTTTKETSTPTKAIEEIVASTPHAAVGSETTQPVTSEHPSTTTTPAETTPTTTPQRVTKRISTIIEPVTTVIEHLIDTIATPFITSRSKRTVTRHRPLTTAIRTETEAIDPSTTVATKNEPMLHASASSPPPAETNNDTLLWLIAIISPLLIGFIFTYLLTHTHPHTK